MSFVPGPGVICYAKNHQSALLLVDEQGGNWLAVDYPVTKEKTLLVNPRDLTAIGHDQASANVLKLRWDSAKRATTVSHAPDPSDTGSGAKSAKSIKTAMVLCAGLGLRLRPLTSRVPKPALYFFNAPLIRYSFALLKNAGVEKVVINTHHLPQIMEKTAADEAKRLGLSLYVSHEPIIQGTAGAIRQAREFLEGQPFLLLNGDAFMSLDINQLIAAHFARGDAATMAVIPMPAGQSYAAVQANAAGEVRRIAGVGQVQDALAAWHFIGAHVLEPSVLDFIALQGEQDINRTVYPAMIAAGLAVRVCPMAVGAWADMGTPRRYLQTCAEVMTGLCDLSGLGNWGPLSVAEAARLRQSGIEKRVHCHSSAKIDGEALLRQTQISASAQVGKASLEMVSVLPETRIADNEQLQGTIAYGELRVPGI